MQDSRFSRRKMRNGETRSSIYIYIYIWHKEHSRARFPTRRLFDAGHLKSVRVWGNLFFFSIPRQLPWTVARELVFLVFASAWNWPRAPSKTVNNAIRNSVQVLFFTLRARSPWVRLGYANVPSNEFSKHSVAWNPPLFFSLIDKNYFSSSLYSHTF